MLELARLGGQKEHSLITTGDLRTGKVIVSN